MEINVVNPTEVSKEFLQGMASRMDVSFAKYGAVKDAYPHKVDAMASLEKRIAKYRETGNTEWLMDVANFAMIEFMCPRHSKAHFRATDSHESPGRTFLFGAEDDRRNDGQSQAAAADPRRQWYTFGRDE